MNNQSRDKSGIKVYRLDNAANLYPAIKNMKRPGVFRVSVDLDEQIDPIILQTALNNTLIRIPGFSVKLHAGLFWHYFVHTNEKIVVEKDVANPCAMMTQSSTGGFLIRVRFHQNRIATEFFHSITDGSGAMIFLKTLVASYLGLLGIKIPKALGVLDTTGAPTKSENRDLFKEFAKNSPTRKTQKARAYHIKGTRLSPSMMKAIIGMIPIESLKVAARNHHATITEYLAAVLIKAIYDHQSTQPTHLKLPIKVQIPVNLRNYFTQTTMRNFSAFVIPGIDPSHGKYSFSEIVAIVHHFLHLEATKKHLQAQVAGNLRYARNPIVRLLPLMIKNNLITLGYKLTGPTRFSSTLSNLGVIEMPREMQAHVKSIGFMLGATPETNISVAVLGFADNVRVTFSRVIEETDIERRFFRFLIEEHVPVHVESYQE